MIKFDLAISQLYNTTMGLSQQTKKRLKDLGVGIVYLFGSRSNETASENSDYDLGAVFMDEKELNRDHLRLFVSLYDLLSEDFLDKGNGAKLDIALLQRANPALAMAAISQGMILFESDPLFRANYEESVIKKYDDYRFLQKEYEEATFTAFTKTSLSE